MELSEFRQQIDTIDDEICKLFEQRMRVVGEIGAYKRDHAIPVTNSGREREVLTRVSKALPPELEPFGRALYRSIFDISKSYESMGQLKDSALYREISSLISAAPAAFPKRAVVACQGREGAYSQMAAERLFEVPEILFNSSFEGVIKTVLGGMAEFGILPIENSTAGSVNEIYDLLVKYDVHIVRSTRVKVDHQLLGARGMRKENVKTIYSHPQAIQQCSHFLSSLKGVQVIPCENTAVGAIRASEDLTGTVASISSQTCANLYGLDILAPDVQDFGSNITRFICISKTRRIYPGANRTSIMMVAPNKPGTLFGILSRFNACGANLVKLESRPIPNREFEFCFYFDIDMSVYDEKFPSLISGLEGSGMQFKYFGTYSEVV